jgi:hypothetical protein
MGITRTLQLHGQYPRWIDQSGCIRWVVDIGVPCAHSTVAYLFEGRRMCDVVPRVAPTHVPPNHALCMPFNHLYDKIFGKYGTARLFCTRLHGMKT